MASQPSPFKLGVPYSIKFGQSMLPNSPNKQISNRKTYHSLQYISTSHLQKGTPNESIHLEYPGQILTDLSKLSANQTSPVSLSFTNSQGNLSSFTGTLKPSKTEFVLLFDGKDFVIEALDSGALGMVEIKKNDRKRNHDQLTAHVEDSKIPDSKRAKASSEIDSRMTAAKPTAAAAPQTTVAPVEPKLSTPVAVPTAIESAPSVTNKMTKSQELKKRASLIDEPDSDDSDDSDLD